MIPPETYKFSPTPTPPKTFNDPVEFDVEDVEFAIYILPDVVTSVSVVELDTFNVPPTNTFPDIPAPPLTTIAPVVTELLCVELLMDTIPEQLILETLIAFSVLVPETFNVPPMYSFPDTPIPPTTVNAPVLVDVLCVLSSMLITPALEMVPDELMDASVVVPDIFKELPK